ncbi:50S ribosomal protein L32 [Mycoplasmopsis equigenitalium]|uniref:Large ribosomal subunit protein bL32 n=1 Tax=Mycoplasmopsis equigenitalium TaxID=114883 RepID=A0ABY5J687_9BACT|nr:50S ribosomal protein L32 [Mycoplasmopsis equigenitalium]UUD37193.1 50S ribosomal protein L32 [Mycoplasmopsis equigenitalium]
MAIVPKRKTSKQRKHLRRTHDSLTATGTRACSNCSKQIEPHVACQFCGFYKNKKVAGFKPLND